MSADIFRQIFRRVRSAKLPSRIGQKFFVRIGQIFFVKGFLAQPHPPEQIFFVKISLIDFLVLVHTLCSSTFGTVAGVLRTSHMYLFESAPYREQHEMISYF